MKIPKQLKVGGLTYKIREWVFKERNDIWGQTIPNTREIRIEKKSDGVKRPLEAIEQTFFHELLHCVDAVYNADKLDEETIERLSNGLYQVLKDNNLLNERKNNDKNKTRR